MRVRTVLLTAGLLAIPAAHAQVLSTQVPATPAARALASRVLDKMDAGPRNTFVLRQTRSGFVSFEREMAGQTATAAGDTFDKYFLPELTARLPELQTHLQDAVLNDLTAEEMQSVLADRQDDARRSAQTKLRQVFADFGHATEDWQYQVVADVFSKNERALRELGIRPVPAKK